MNAKTNLAQQLKNPGTSPQLTDFATRFLEYLSQSKEAKLKEISEYQLASRNDEAKFARIEANVIEIYEKMFFACLSKKELSNSSNWKTNLKSSYEHYFKTISANWFENLSKCEQFELDEEAHIERLKIDQMTVIKICFLTALEKSEEVAADD